MRSKKCACSLTESVVDALALVELAACVSCDLSSLSCLANKNAYHGYVMVTEPSAPTEICAGMCAGIAHKN